MVEVTIDDKWKRFFKILTQRDPASGARDSPLLPFETMGTINFNTKGRFESVRARLGHGSERSPVASRPSPTDLRSRLYNTAYHTHFYDPNRLFNVPTVQDVMMFAVYNAVTRFFVLRRGSEWGTVRELELVFSDKGVYTMTNAPEHPSRFSDKLLKTILGETHTTTLETDSDIELYALELATKYCVKRDGELSVAVKRAFPEISRIDVADDVRTVRYMQDEQHHRRYMNIFLTVAGVQVSFFPWNTDKITLNVQMTGRDQVYIPLNM